MKSRHKRYLAALFLCLIILVISPVVVSCGCNASTSAPGNNNTVTEAFVTQVIDGDTIVIEGGVRVRYIGIDTPELADPENGTEYFALEAAEKNRELVERKTVRLERDVQDTDRYGRLLRYVWVGDTMVNAELVRLGYAYSVSYPPNIKYQAMLLQLEREARDRGLGLWATSDGS